MRLSAGMWTIIISLPKSVTSRNVVKWVALKTIISNLNSLSLFKAISDQLKRTNEAHGGRLVNLADLIETERQLSEKEVLLSLYGQYNAGKSTLINALLQNR